MKTKNTIHDKEAAARAGAGTQTSRQPAVIKLGLDIHAQTYVVRGAA